MTGLGELLGHGTPAEQTRIRHDLGIIRHHGLDALRHQIDGAPVPADLYIAALALVDQRQNLRAHAAAEKAARVEADEEARSIRRGGNR